MLSSFHDFELAKRSENIILDFKNDFNFLGHAVQWIKKERFAEFYHWLPQNAGKLERLLQPEEEVEDPYRTVLFEDIKPFLFDIHDRDLIFNLILHFVHFLGAPVTDNTIFNSPLLYTFWKSREDTSLFDFPFSSPNSGFGVFFTDINWFRNVGEEHLNFIEASGANKNDFIRNVFDQTMKIGDFKDRILPFILMYECSFDYKQ